MELESISNGRPMKFTPERLEQIRNLVERGKTRDGIAELIGSTVGSLQVTCSRLGISLRKSKQLRSTPEVRMEPNGIADATNGEKTSAEINMVMSFRGMTRTTKVNIDHATITKLVLEANVRSMSLGELVADMIERVLHDDALLDRVAPRIHIVR